MTREEIKAALTLCFVNYPKNYQGMSNAEKQILVDTWERQFRDIPAEAFRHILDQHFRTSKFAPTIADIHEQLSLVTGIKTDNDLWNECIKLIRRGTVLTREELDKASPPVREWLRDIQNVRELSQLDPTTTSTVLRGQFLKTIGQVKQSIQARESIPEHLINGIRDTKLLRE